MSHHVVLPFPGAWIDQPSWIKSDFYLFMRLAHWWELNSKLPETTGLPNAEDV